MTPSSRPSVDAPAHTPFDGLSMPFTIGLKPLAASEWIEVDDAIGDYLNEKARLNRELPAAVFMAEPDTCASQQEVLDELSAFLPHRFPTIFTRSGDVMYIAPGNRHVELDVDPAAPLRTAAMLVQEDLVLMRKGDDGWRLAAASLCFPSSWSLAEKFGRPMAEIHAPVPGFGAGTRPAELIERMFDRLQGQLVERYNWSLTVGPALYLPLSQVEREDRGVERSRFPGADPAACAFIRIERQTLRKMPVSGDILFTIRIHVDPLGVLSRHPDRPRLAAGLADQIDALDEAQLAYKGLLADRDRLVTALRQIASR